MGFVFDPCLLSVGKIFLFSIVELRRHATKSESVIV